MFRNRIEAQDERTVHYFQGTVPLIPVFGLVFRNEAENRNAQLLVSSYEMTNAFNTFAPGRRKTVRFRTFLRRTNC
ncbi:hypothetical protein FHS90_002595 [Rufibacter quisquiliarum]|uniref:Uncharacterized protein n=1 Tax=Rufibacter quisquiliarum TaxID=1549639 RepID=A0A839GSU2_9BACT|nr:hypothetical protein [Rufibacter quisquiliarum]